MLKKVLSVALMVLVVVNLLLFAFRVVSAVVFWVVLAVAAALAYLVLPRIR